MSKDINKNDVNILIIDDERLIRESLYEILRIEGYNVNMAQSAEEAMGLLEHEDFDVILTDMKLPQKSGIELLEHVKNEHAHIEVILIT
ncbi:MAG: response regulator, partial [Candidatus Omnitrophica bacterium]|nr:response regulator [Candidatus Omnitrophota bacterium]